MAGIEYVLKATDFLSQLFPLNLVVAGKNYRILTKATNIQFISDNLDVVSKQLEKLLPPEPPKDPIFIDCINGQIVIPQVLFQNEEPQETQTRSECSSASCDVISQASTSDNPIPQSQPQTPIYQDDSDCEDSGMRSSRYEWKLTTTRKLLNVLEEKKKAAPESFSINKKIWAGISKEISKTETNCPSSNQCREKFYTLKRSYRKFLSECKKTGNKTPKPFRYEIEMQSILEGDPSFKPLVLRSSFGMRKDDDESDEDTIEQEDDASTSSASRPTTPIPTAKTKKRKIDEMKEYFEERDKKFFEVMENMQNSNKELLTKLIEKLGK
ncbi:uncharacterized protein LOC133191348 [Saccostrea echinata]|uniref:uncharacterized protein LOC133179497 n=1 Tax=Saccostrea echinata TaxID=191078 RepID=UPI002A83C05A|nr:uncharacterized protein LOC133179497 [Saccostrea echinata]XP_061183078.1 uncharacterized protein LOC133191348 [Saccostrea echinata]